MQKLRLSMRNLAYDIKVGGVDARAMFKRWDREHKGYLTKAAFERLVWRTSLVKEEFATQAPSTLAVPCTNLPAAASGEPRTFF